ncbi:uncharacterized protein LOC114946189 [Nylanderia fulva]|uniref:uncharacterized protein LOC114946189 n=1 Tax=Nylanderia fulva TaxID=613905 RepID=UPI0010FBB3D8|nr:uncharacterized protein LOC114946189 [Nylanderia fulva]
MERQGGVPQLQIPERPQQPQEEANLDEEEAIFIIEEKKRQGRPITTGESEKLKTRRAQEAKEKDLQKEKEILDPQIKPEPKKSYKAFLDSIRDKEEICKEASIADLEAMISEKCADIYKVSVQSGNMKGTFTKAAKEAAADMCAAATVLAMKAQNPQETNVENQMAEMRHQMRILRMENAELRRVVERLGRQNKKQEKENPPKPLEEKRGASLAWEKGERTERWVSENSPLSGDGGTPDIGTIRTSGIPLPPTDREPSENRGKGTPGGTLPPKGGVPPGAPKEEYMEVEEWRSDIFKKEEFPPLGRKRKGNGPSPLPQNRRKIVDIVEQEDKEEKEERYRREALVAMMEGVCERIMDRRLGNPMPSFAQKKEAEKMRRKEQGNTEKKLPAPRKGKREPTAKTKNTQITTLIPPAKPGMPRIKAIEKVSLNVLK